MKALSFFPGSNTCRGFHGYFAELLPANDMRRVYILKGGPGVGKSTLMRRVGAAWEKQGRQVEYYWCSGDPGSLDAVVADGCMLMDGTSPHVVDPVLPGAADGIVNLGECLDETVMAAHRQEVIPLHRAMARCYSRAYHYLTGAEAALRDMQEIYAQAVDQGTLINLRMELMQRVTGCAGRCQHLYAQAITGEGVREHLASVVRENTVCLDLPFGFDADCILRPLQMHLAAKGVGHRAFMHPLDGKRQSHLATDSWAVATFVEKGCETRTLPFDPDILQKEHESLSFNRAAHDLLLNQAIDSLHAAHDLHDRLERIYADAMDYKKLDDLQGKTVQRLMKI